MTISEAFSFRSKAKKASPSIKGANVSFVESLA